MVNFKMGELMESWRQELYENGLYHHGIPGQKWGVRRYQNLDGSVTAAGANRYYEGNGSDSPVRWGLAKGERDSTGATHYVSPSSSGGGGGAGWKPSSSRYAASSDDAYGKKAGDDEDEGPQMSDEERLNKSRSIVENVRANREAWLEDLKAKKRASAESEDEKEAKGSKGSSSTSKSSGVSMTAEEIAQALAKILGEGSSEKKEEPEPEKEEESEENEINPNDLSEEEEKALSNYMVDPITSKVYMVDEETGEAYEINQETGEASDKSVNLQKNKLEGLLGAVRSGADNFKDSFNRLVQNIRKKKAGSESGDEDYDAAKSTMIEADDAARLRSQAKAEENDKGKSDLTVQRKKKE